MLGEMLIHRVCWLLPDIWVLVIPVRKARVLESVAACRHVGAVVALVVYHFMTGVMENMVGCLLFFIASSFSFRSLAILLYLQSFVK